MNKTTMESMNTLLIQEYIKSFFQSFSYIVFVKNRFLGFLLFSLTLLKPSLAILSITAYTATIFLGILLGINHQKMVQNFYTYNSILVGLSLGYLFEPTLHSILFVILASFFTLLLSIALTNFFGYFLTLPILNLPFAITVTFVHLSSVRYSNLFIVLNKNMDYLNLDFLPLYISGLFKSVGILMFMPYDLIGIFILFLTLIYSRINFFLAVGGYYTGTLFVLFLTGSSVQAYTNLYAFNFVILAIALGGLFLIPAIKSYIIAFVAVLISVFVLDAMNVFWSSYGIPVLTLPFTVVTLIFIYVLKVNRYPFITEFFQSSPEENLEHYLTYSARYKVGTPQIQLPFTGEWKVFQGNHGQWTHKGVWCFAIDFVIENRESKKTFKEQGLYLQDYYCFNKPVLSPISGIIIEIYDGASDNTPGTVNTNFTWGNYVIIQSSHGWYVEISHFAQSSILVKKGEYVTTGQMLGKCGNSGYSPEPHLHVQVQYHPIVGAATSEFNFTHCISDNSYIFEDTQLQEGQYVRPMLPSRWLYLHLQLLLGDTYTYNIYKNGKLYKAVTFTIHMNEFGYYYFYDREYHTSLFFFMGDGIFSFSRLDGSNNSFLKYLFISLPRIPLTDALVSWEDTINPTLLLPKQNIDTFFKSFNHRFFTAKGNYSFTEKDTIKGSVYLKRLVGKMMMQTEIKVSEFRGFSYIKISEENGNTIELKLTTTGLDSHDK